ncbi:F-box/kelch-repeat protein At3g06240-like [Pistacia vera]|uniref:F-box/kelch-repeat protein At3g06240-like n=1 Tax=Pistacia vera TaxID=55513 RepID=UPI0012636B6B|nr:F-box/kelch-repeat protein At3g06240-like [Pistacia vera]
MENSGKKDTKHVPDDLVYNIFQRLPGKSLLRLRCASKMWCNNIDGISFANSHEALCTAGDVVSEEPQVLSVPLLLGSIVKKVHSLVYDGNDNLMKRNEYPILEFLSNKQGRDYRISQVAYGLLCIEKVDHAQETFLCNPLRGEVLELPGPGLTNRESIGHTMWYGMGFDSTTDWYKVVRMYYVYEVCEFAAEVYTLGTDSWRRIATTPSCYLSLPGVSAYGDMHWRRHACSNESEEERGKMILTFDFKKEEFKWLSHPDFGCKPCEAFRLINLRGSLAVVSFPSNILIEIWVLKDYKSEHYWEREHKIIIDQLWVREPETGIIKCDNDLSLWKKHHRANNTFSAGVGAAGVGTLGHDGIFFDTNNDKEMFLLDLQTDRLWYKQKQFPLVEGCEGYNFHKDIFNYTGSVLSLRNFARNYGIFEESVEDMDSQKYSFLKTARHVYISPL